MRIAVDIGYGFTKAVSDEGKEILFPSIVAKKFSGTLEGILGKVQEEHVVSLAYEDGREEIFYVGDAAMTVGATRTWEEEAAKNRNLIVLVATAVALLNSKNEPVDLAVGLPLAFFNTQRKSIKEALENLKLKVKVGEKEADVTVNSVFVFPQSAGVYYSALHEIDGSFKNLNLFNKQVGIIDVGYRTVDILYMARAKKGLMPREELSGSMDLGMNIAHKEIALETRKLVKGNPDLVDVEKAILWFNGDIEWKGNTYNLRQIQSEAYNRLAFAILNWIKQTWGDEVNSLSTVIVGGGGGDALYPYFENALPAVMKVDKPEFANARGYLAAQALAMKVKE